MTQSQTAPSVDGGASNADGTLEPFPGNYIPGLCFESGHCLWLLEFAATPTRFDSYTEVWLITPDGERVLYTDPEEAADEVLRYHDFDRTVGADVVHESSPSDTITLSMNGTDGTSLEMSADLAQTVGTRILNAVIALTPGPVLRSRVGTFASTTSLNLLVDANGLRVAGRTETDRRYRLDADRIHRIMDASATLDGTDLGAVHPPNRPIEFGDAKTTAEPLYVPGTLHLERFDR